MSQAEIVRSLGDVRRETVAYMLAICPAETQTFVAREIRAILDKGHHVVVFALKRPAITNVEESLWDAEMLRLIKYARPDNVLRHLLVNIISLSSHPFKYCALLKVFVSQILVTEPVAFIRSLYHLFCAIGFCDEMRSKGVTHIHSHFASGSTMALAASRFLGVPFSFAAHASGDIFVKPILLNQKMKHSSFVTPVCDYSKAYLDSITDYGYSEKLYRIYNGVLASEPERFGVAKRHKGPNGPERALEIISVGTLVGCKGHVTLILACQLLKERGYKFKCRIIGEGMQKSILINLIRTCRLDDEVSLTGYLPSRGVYHALATADVFALLSEIHVNGYRDGFPTVILEAMLMELPVVSTWMSGIPEMVRDGSTGFLVPERDPLSAATAIEKLIVNEGLRNSFGAEGRKSVLEKFDLEKSNHLLVDLFINQGSART